MMKEHNRCAVEKFLVSDAKEETRKQRVQSACPTT